MLESLRSLFAEVTGGGAPASAFAADDYRVAAVALLVHLAVADGVLDAAEQARLQRLVEERYALDPSSARKLIAQASVEEREAVDLFQFTHLLKNRLDVSARQSLVEALWEIAYADGKLHELEDSVISRIAELLAVSPRARVESRQRAQAEGAEIVHDAGPWGTRTADAS